MPRPRVFISFSHQDRDFVQRLFDRLRAQPIELWDYSHEDQEIPIGSPVLPYLRERIEPCAAFIAVVSPRSFESRYTQEEVRHALHLSQDGRLRIIPLVLAHCPLRDDWPAPYAELATIRSYGVQSASGTTEERIEARASLEESLRRICGLLGVEYVPPALEDPRLPFMVKFDSELHEAYAHGEDFRHPEHRNAIIQRLTDARNDVVAALQEGRFSLGLSRVSYFIAMCEYELPMHPFYYPYIVKGICLASSGQWLPALDILLPLQQHPLKDENLFGLLGYVKQQQGAFREALGYYQLSAQRDPHDPAAKHGLLLNALLSHTEVDVDTLLREVESAPVALSQDRHKVLLLRAFAYASAGRLGEAIAAYEAMQADGLVDTDMLVNFAHCLGDAQWGDFGRAVALLEQYEGKYGLDGNYQHHLATLCFQAGQVTKALRRFDDLVAHYPPRRQYYMDAARVYWHSGHRAKAEAQARMMLDRKRFGLPTGSNDFFCDGFANWVLGHHARADYDFERSGFSPEHHYHYLLEDPPC